MFSVGSSLFLFRRFCLEHVRTAQLTDDLWNHQKVSHKSNNVVSCYIVFKMESKKRLVLMHKGSTKEIIK